MYLHLQPWPSSFVQCAIAIIFFFIVYNLRLKKISSTRSISSQSFKFKLARCECHFILHTFSSYRHTYYSHVLILINILIQGHQYVLKFLYITKYLSENTSCLLPSTFLIFWQVKKLKVSKIDHIKMVWYL